MAANFPTNYEQVRIPELSQNLHDFTHEATRCLEEIHGVATSTILSNPEKQQKYIKLGELRHRIRAAGNDIPRDLKDLNRAIKKEMGDLKDQYQTNSHWLVLTQRQSHFVQTTPDIGRTPHVKIDPSDLDDTFDKIILLPRGIEKIRAIQFLHKQVIESGQDDIEELQKRILDFSDRNLTLSEKILSLKQINWRDKDQDQMRELSSLLDPTGKYYVQHFLNNRTSPKEVIQYVAVILKDRHFINPGRTPIELIKEWPQTIRDQDTSSREEWTFELMKLTRYECIEDPYTNLVISYLLNIVDPSGLIRCEYINRKTKNTVLFAKEVGIVIDTLVQFDLNPNAIFHKYKIIQKNKRGQKGQAVDDINQKMHLKRLSKDEVSFYVQCLKTAIADQWASFNMRSFLSDPSSFGSLVGDRISRCDAYAERIKAEIKGAESVKEQAFLISNYLTICSQLMIIGEFGLSFTLFASGLDNTKSSCREAWVIALKKHYKEHKFLEQAVDPSSNMKNLRSFIANRQSKSLLCIPFFAIVGKDTVQFQEQLSQPRNNLFEEIEREYPELTDDILKALVRDTSKDLDWVKRHFFSNSQLLLKVLGSISGCEEIKAKAEQLYLQEMDIHLEIDRRGRELSRQMSALQFYYQNQTVVPSILKLLEPKSDSTE